MCGRLRVGKNILHVCKMVRYLPLVKQEAAGLPLNPTFTEQKKIFKRCQGRFFLCAGGSEARRFNRLLIDAGRIKGL